jgi:ATP-dependent helicase HrpA
MVERAYLADQPLARTKFSYEKALQRGRERLGTIAQEFVQFLPHLFSQYHETRRALEQTRGPGWDHLLNSMKLQLASLVHPTFLIETPWPWLIQYPRYFQGIRQRLQRLSSGGLKTEQTLESEFAPWLARYEQKLKDHQRQQKIDPMLSHYRWMLEEFRIQLFAQKLGTAISVSSAKLEEQLGRVL